MSRRRRWRGMRRSWYRHARRLRARCAAREGHQGNVARALDGHTQPALVPRAHAGHPARKNLAALLHELRQDVRAFVIDEVHLLHTELANFLLPEILALAARTPSRASGTARSAASRTSFASRASMPTVSAFTPRSSAWRCCLFLFLCHTFHPFTFRPGPAGVHPFVNTLKAGSRVLKSPTFSRNRPSSMRQPVPALEQLQAPWCVVDAAQRASRASAKTSSGASSLRPA